MHTSRALDESTWDLFADLVERNGGIYGGCWCLAYHPGKPEGLSNREAKHQRVLADAAHAALVLDEQGRAQGWAQYGRTSSPGSSTAVSTTRTPRPARTGASPASSSTSSTAGKASPVRR